MSPIAAAIAARAILAAVSAAAVPSAVNVEPSSPIPTSPEEAAIQAVIVLLVFGANWLKKRFGKSPEKENGAE